MIDPAAHDSLGSALDAAFARWGDAIAHVESDRDRDRERLSYASLGARRLAFARFLRERGVRPGDRVAIVMTNQAKWHVAASAVLHVGGVLVPLDWKLPGPEHRALLAHARPAVLVAEHHLWGLMAAGDDDRPLPPTVVVTEAPPGREPPAPGGVAPVRWETIEGVEADGDGAGGRAATRHGADPSFPPAARTRDDVAGIVYSSGTGGRPKGCQLTHGNYLEQFRALTQLHAFHADVRYLSILPTNHAIDFMVGFLGPYLCGATVVHLRTLRPEFVRSAFPRYGITHVALVPLVLRNLENGLRARFAELPPLRRRVLDGLVALNRALSRGRPKPALARRLLPAVHGAFGGRLEAIYVGGAWSDPATLRFFHDLGLPVANGYGLTECGTAITLDRLDPPRPDTVGQPLPGIEVRIDAPDAEGVGEVVVRSPMVMRGYLDDPELTAETIVDGWLRTGDLGRLDDGALRLLGRRKNMIVTAGGKNVYPEDVETAFEGLAGVKEMCVFAAHWLAGSAGSGSGSDRDERLLLVVRLDPDAPVAPTDVLAETAARNRRLRDYQRVAGVVFHGREFPRTASMKVKRQALADDVGPPRVEPLP